MLILEHQFIPVWQQLKKVKGAVEIQAKTRYVIYSTKI